MLFSSMIFLWCFLPIVLIINFILSHILVVDDATRFRMKNVWLLLASIVFYAWGGINYLAIMLACIAINFCSGKFMHTSSFASKKVVLSITVIINISILFVFKYANMVAGIVGAKNWTEIALPIGISFYTFQAMSYVIDVYRDESKVQNNLLEFALYVSLFPQLVAGPIVKYSDISEQIHDRKESINLFYEGQKRFCYGLGKKVLIANTCAQIVDEIWAGDISNMGAGIAWLGAVAYTLQIYYDFSGYSDMAIGIGRMLGFRFKENFNYPYLATSIQDFWRRWHISLSGWFRDYVYIPLGGSRRGITRTCINIMVVFALTGIWHGAGYTFMAWGLIYGLILVVERLWLGEKLKNNSIKIINYVYTMLVVVFAWILFRANSISQARTYICSMFKVSNTYMTVESYISMLRIISIVAGIAFMGPVQTVAKKCIHRLKGKDNIVKGLSVADMICQLVVLVASIMALVSGTYNPFIYFRF